MSRAMEASSGLRLTSRDVQILQWLSGFRTGATATQVASRFGMEASRARRRLAQLRRAALLAHERIFWAQPGPYLVTAEGRAVAGVERPEPRIDLRVYRHDLAVVDLAIEFELAGRVVVPALAAEALEPPASEGARYVLTLPGGERRFPDLTLEDDGKRLGVELLTAGDDPPPGGLTALLEAYRDAPHLAGVVVYVEVPAIRAELEAAAAAVLTPDRFELRSWSAPDDGSPDLG